MATSTKAISSAYGLSSSQTYFDLRERELPQHYHCFLIAGNLEASTIPAPTTRGLRRHEDKRAEVLAI